MSTRNLNLAMDVLELCVSETEQFLNDCAVCLLFQYTHISKLDYRKISLQILPQRNLSLYEFVKLEYFPLTLDAGKITVGRVFDLALKASYNVTYAAYLYES